MHIRQRLPLHIAVDALQKSLGHFWEGHFVPVFGLSQAVPYEQAASNGSHIKFDSFLQTKYAPGSRAKPPSPYVSQYNSKFNMHMGHYEKRGLIDEKAKHPIVRYSNRPVSAGDLASVNKYKSRVASVRLYQET